MQQVQSLWVGDKLGMLEAWTCLRFGWKSMWVAWDKDGEVGRGARSCISFQVWLRNMMAVRSHWKILSRRAMLSDLSQVYCFLCGSKDESRISFRRLLQKFKWKKMVARTRAVAVGMIKKKINVECILGDKTIWFHRWLGCGMWG